MERLYLLHHPASRWPQLFAVSQAEQSLRDALAAVAAAGPGHGVPGIFTAVMNTRWILAQAATIDRRLCQLHIIGPMPFTQVTRLRR